MTTTEPIEIPIEGDARDFIADAKKVQEQMDILAHRLDKAGVSQAAYNKAVANARTTAQQSTTATKQSALSITDLRSAYMMAADAARLAGQAYEKTIGISMQYSDVIREASGVTGTSAQETSKLIQVLDNYGIAQSDIMTATKALTKEGYTPTIETLANLSDKYNQLQTQQEKNKFVMDNLGKGGLKWVEVLKKGGDALREQGSEINKSLILNQKQVDASKALFLEMDDLKDASTGLSAAVGNYLTPAMQVLVHATTGSANSLAEWFAQLAENRSISIETSRILKEQGLITQKGTTATKEQIEAAKLQATINVRTSDSVKELNGDIDDNTAALDAQKEAVQNAKDALSDYESQLEAVSQANQDMESMSRTIAEDQKQYAKDHADAAATLGEAIAKGDKEGIAEAQKSIQELEATWHESANNMIYDMVLVGLSAGGLLDSEQKALDEYAVKAGIKTQADIDEANRRREIADSTIAGILQSEDVLAEQRKVDAETLRLQNEITSAESVNASNNEAAAVGQVSQMTQQEIHNQMLLASAAKVTASSYAAIKYPNGTAGAAPLKPYNIPAGTIGGRDNGGAGVAGVPYMIGVKAQPEVFVPSTNGTFIPNADKKGFGGSTYNIVVNNPKKETAEASIRAAMKELAYTGAVA